MIEKLWEVPELEEHLDEDCQILYDYIIENHPKNILEIGTGTTTLVIAQALKKNSALNGDSPHFISIDIDKTRQDKFQKTLEETTLIPSIDLKLVNQDSVSYISYNCAKEIFDLIFLDSKHTFEQTLIELNLLNLIIKPKGSIFIHDTKIPQLLSSIYIFLSNVKTLEFYEYNTYFGLGVLRRK